MSCLVGASGRRMVAGRQKENDVGEQERIRAAGKRGPLRCLLVHGFNGEPMDLCEIERSLEARGFATSALLLPGHGTCVDDFASTCWDDWIGAVHGEVRRSLA